MKTIPKRPNKEIQLAVWQFMAVIIAAIACLFAIVPLTARYRSKTCDVIYAEKPVKSLTNNSETSSDFHARYVRDIAPRDECGIIPPMCSATTTLTPASTTTSGRTTRTTVSTVSVTRPEITNFPTTTRTTTPDPWVNTTRPYNSWRLPTFAKPIDYTLRIACPDCFTSLTDTSAITFNGQVIIRINVTNTTDYLVLHAKNLNITQASLISGSTGTATITYLPEFEMIYLSFNSTTIAIGEITLQIDYTGQINQQDQTGFYRELFWKSNSELRYLLGGNFQPIHARKAFPCFDEPSFQATFTLTLEHPQNSTMALSNLVGTPQNDSTTTFPKTPSISTYSFAWVILPRDEFELVTQTILSTQVNIWIRPELVGAFNSTFEIVGKTFQFIEDYLNVSNGSLPAKLDLIGIPDLTLDEKSYSAWGLRIFREEFLSIDPSLNSAERIQTTAKIIVEHVLQPWFSTTDWWDNIWFGKSLSLFLTYKMLEQHYPSFQLMEQFPIREMVPLMMDDFKPSIWPVSNKNLTNNEQILDYLSTNIYSKGASLLRLLEYIVGPETFQTAVRSIFSITQQEHLYSTFYSNFDLNTSLNTTVTAEELLRSWLEERNYPIVTIDLIRSNDTIQNTTVIFRQTRYFGSFALNHSLSDPDYAWKIYMECDLGGVRDEDNWNLTANYSPSKIRFLLQSSTEVIQILNEDYLWIKCNKDFYSYHVTEYVSSEDNPFVLYEYLELLFPDENIFSSNDKANLLNDAFIIPHGGEIATYDQGIGFVREMFRDPPSLYIPWSVFVWHWNYLMGVEEHSKYFWNFKQFATRQILALFNFDIDNIVIEGTTYQERLLKSMFFELLCRVQYPDALNKATELFRRIPSSYFSNSSGDTNVSADYLSTVIYYHIQNINDMDEWDYLWINFTENQYISSQQRQTFLRALGAAKEIWRLKLILETAWDPNAKLVHTQEFFDLITSISQNPNGRDVVWNFYRHNYASFLSRYGGTNRLFNQLITDIVHSFENEYYYFEMMSFIDQYPSSSQNQQLALDQISINFDWLINGMAEALDDAISSADKHNSEE